MNTVNRTKHESGVTGKDKNTSVRGYNGIPYKN
jgi:hypothetical protein